MIDLHMHSLHSDGIDSVIDILNKAEQKHLEYISITDHNTCSAYNELKEINIEKYYSGKIITGIELNTTVLEIPIEVLGYKFDTELMKENLKGMYLSSEQRNMLEVERLYNKCIKSGIKLNKDFVDNYSPNVYASKYLHDVLIQNEENKKFIDDEAWADNLVLYRKYMSDPKSIFFVDMNDVLPSLNQTIELIKKCNGLVFIPHIFEYKHNSMKILSYILENYKIDGIECYYSTFTYFQTKKLLQMCKQKGLLSSGGSDYHGLHEPKINIGIGLGNLRIDKSLIYDWI